MSVLGIGAPELVIILLMVVVILGPDRARDAGASLGRFIKRLSSTETWRDLLLLARYVQQLPQNLVRLANLEEEQNRLKADLATTQQAIRDVAEPLQSISPAKVLGNPLRAVGQEVKQALTGGPAQPAPAPISPEPLPARPPAVPASVAQPPDADLARQVQDLARYAEEWPATVERLAALEQAQADLAEQIEHLRAAVTTLAAPAGDGGQS